jgi:polygalacturonase
MEIQPERYRSNADEIMKTLSKQCLVLMLVGAISASALAQAGKIFDVRESGAKGDGKTDDTAGDSKGAG